MVGVPFFLVLSLNKETPKQKGEKGTAGVLRVMQTVGPFLVLSWKSVREQLQSSCMVHKVTLFYGLLLRNLIYVAVI